MKKRLLFLEDLYDFYLNKYKRSTRFSAEKTGHQVFVQVPAQFEVDDEYKDDSLLFCKVKLMHSGENRNHSNVTDEALEKAAKGLAYKPILANFMEYTDEETNEVLKDFTSHDMELKEDGTINYIEKQIGCFTSDEPFFEVEEETGHNFLYGYCAIPFDYTDAASIIKRKGGTKVSVELAINSMEFDVKKKVLNLTDVVIMGATCLGKDPHTLNDVEEGMLNARLDIVDFSAENNSVLSNYQSQMIDFQARLEKLESACFNNILSEEGGNQMNKLEELLSKYNVVLEDITFEYEGLSDEELEAKFSEVFEDDDNASDPNNDDDEGTVDPSNDGNKPEDGEEGDNNDKDNEEEDGESTFEEHFEEMVKTFTISHEDIRYALYNLLSSFEEQDNEWYYITAVYDDYFVYESWNSGSIWGQKYSKGNDTIAFDGERYELFKEYITKSEKTQLEEMRANYSIISEKLAAYELAEELADKSTVFEDEAYAGYLETEEFKYLMSEEAMKKFTKKELEEKADAALGKIVKSSKTFSLKEEPKKEEKPAFFAFAKSEKTSFLDALLEK